MRLYFIEVAINSRITVDISSVIKYTTLLLLCDAEMSWRDSWVEITTAIIGSGLIAAVFTGLIAEINQPQLHISIIPHEKPPIFEVNPLSNND